MIKSTYENEEKNEEEQINKTVKTIRKLKPETVRLNGVSVNIAYFGGFPLFKEDAQRLEELRKQFINTGMSTKEVEIKLKAESRKLQRKLSKYKQALINGENVELLDEKFKNANENLEFSYVTCFLCKEKGHKSNNCPSKKGNNFEENVQEKSCKSVVKLDEMTKSNSKSKVDAFVTCFVCKMTGHKSMNCPKKNYEENTTSLVNVKPNADSSSESFKNKNGKSMEFVANSETTSEFNLKETLDNHATCFVCKIKGHKSMNCPKKNGPDVTKPESKSTCNKNRQAESMDLVVNDASPNKNDDNKKNKSSKRKIETHQIGENHMKCIKNEELKIDCFATCFICKEKGHKSTNCPQKIGGESNDLIPKKTTVTNEKKQVIKESLVQHKKRSISKTAIKKKKEKFKNRKPKIVAMNLKVKMVHAKGYYMKQDDEKKLEELKQQLTSNGLGHKKVKNALRVARRKAERDLYRSSMNKEGGAQ